MMDLMILVAVFIAILALAYFTYRNIVGLDTRLRKIEDVLRNAEVVASPVQQLAPSESGESSVSHVSAWGGEGPEVNVERMPADEEQPVENTHDVQILDLPDDGESLADDEADDDGDSDTDLSEEESISNIVDDIVGNEDDHHEDQEFVHSEDEGDDVKITRTVRSGDLSGAKVGDLKDALKRAGVSFPPNAKKALLVSLIQQHNLELSD